MSNNIVNVRTCSDSFFALLQLIQYIAADGDLVPSYEPEPPDTAKTPTVCMRINVWHWRIRRKILQCINTVRVSDSKPLSSWAAGQTGVRWWWCFKHNHEWGHGRFPLRGRGHPWKGTWCHCQLEKSWRQNQSLMSKLNTVS